MAYKNGQNQQREDQQKLQEQRQEEASKAQEERETEQRQQDDQRQKEQRDEDQIRQQENQGESETVVIPEPDRQQDPHRPPEQQKQKQQEIQQPAQQQYSAETIRSDHLEMFDDPTDRIAEAKLLDQLKEQRQQEESEMDGKTSLESEFEDRSKNTIDREESQADRLEPQNKLQESETVSVFQEREQGQDLTPESNEHDDREKAQGTKNKQATEVEASVQAKEKNNPESENQTSLQSEFERLKNEKEPDREIEQGFEA